MIAYLENAFAQILSPGFRSLSTRRGLVGTQVLSEINIVNKRGITTLSGKGVTEFNEAILAIRDTVAYVAANLFEKNDKNKAIILDSFLGELVYVIDLYLASEEVEYTAVLTRVRAMIMANTWAGKLDEKYELELDYKAIPKNLIYTPLDYQRAYLENHDINSRKYDLRGSLMSSAPGAGKTPTTLFMAEATHSKTILIICPKVAIQSVWTDSLETIYKKTPSYWTSLDPIKDLKKGTRYIIIHNEYVLKMPLIKKFLKGDLYIALDEAHNFNELSAAITTTIIDTVNSLNPRNVSLLSGTPIKADYKELIPQMRLIDKHFTPAVEKRFLKIFKQFRGESTGDILRRRLAYSGYTVTKDRLGLQDPIKTFVPVDLGKKGKRFTLTAVKEQMIKYALIRLEYYKKVRSRHERIFWRIQDAYRDGLAESEMIRYNAYRVDLDEVIRGNNYMLLRPRIKEVSAYEKTYLIPTLSSEDKKAYRDSGAVIKYVELKVLGETLGNVLGKLRIECFKEIAATLDIRKIMGSSTNKTLIFSSYIGVCDTVVDTLKDTHRCATVYGGSTPEVTATIKAFHEDKALNPLVATFSSLSTAVPVTVVDRVIFINVPYRDYTLSQALSRAHRLGNAFQVHGIFPYLVTGDEENLSSRGLDILVATGDVASEITGIDTILTDMDLPDDHPSKSGNENEQEIDD